jgi:putative transposase
MWQPSQLTAQQKEERRFEGVRLLQEGWSQAEVARHLGVNRKTVYGWQQRQQTGGHDALRTQPKSGRKPYLDAQQWQQVLELLQQGPQALGFETARWTLWRIQWVIAQRFGVSYNTNYLSQKLHQLGWSPQKPAVYARERNDELVQAWLQGDWPRIQQRLAAWERR